MPQGIRVISVVFKGIYYTFGHFEAVMGAWVLTQSPFQISNTVGGWCRHVEGRGRWGWPTTLIYMHTCSNGPRRCGPKLVRLQVKTYKLAPEEGTACFLGLEQSGFSSAKF